MSLPTRNLIVFDCDSTLSSIEGIDELGALRGPETLAACERMTNDAMEGRLPIESIFAERLKLIRPGKSEVDTVARKYIDTLEPGAQDVIATLKERGWSIAIVSGGFRQAIEPVASLLKADLLEAVDLFFGPDGTYEGYDASAPTARNGGKPDVLKEWRKAFQLKTIVMVGDGSSDLETKHTADLFVGFGRYVRRPKVEENADAFILALSDLPDVLKNRLPQS